MMKLISVLGLAAMGFWCSAAGAQVAINEDTPEQLEAQRELGEAKRAVHKIGRSCQDVAHIREMAKSAEHQPAKDVYQEAVRERVKAALQLVIDSQQALRIYNNEFWWQIGDLDDGSHSDEPTANEAIDSVKAKFEESKCYVTEEKRPLIDKMIADLADFRVGFAEHQAKEAKCRKNKACRAKRLAMRNAQDLCELYDQRAMFQQVITEEKRNPSGVVDLVRLHDAGVGIQETDAQIKEAKVTFKAKTKANFNKAICKDLPIDKETGEYLKAPAAATAAAE